MIEAIELYGLNHLFRNMYFVKDKNSLVLSLQRILYLVKNIIHLYTGMRNEEVFRLPNDCILEYEIVSATLDESGKEIDSARVIKLLSTTTKFEGYKKSESWFAPPEVVKAIHVGQRISKAINE
jgi:hypothetical protein